MTLTKRQQRYMQFAIRVADSAPYRQKYRMGCVLIKGGVPVNFGVNNASKTHPRARIYAFPYIHAELAALIGVNKDETRGATAYVARVSRKHKCLSLACPCPICQSELRKAGVRDVYYTTRDGGVEKMRL